jgi:hypothetical protein
LTGPGAADFNVVNNNCTTLALNATCSFNVTASPTQSASRNATLTLSDSTATVQQTISLGVLGSNPPPVANPTTLAFAYMPLGTTSAAQSFTVTSFNNDPVIAQLSDPAYVPFVLTQGSSCSATPCQVSVVFAPTAANTAPAVNPNSYANILVTDLLSGQAALVSLSGALQPPPPLPPPTTVTTDSASLTFDPQTVGTISSGQTITVTNTGNQPFVMSVSLTGDNPGDYALSNPCSQLAAAGQGFNTCTFFIQFSPTATGTRTANVQITGNISSPILIPLTGTGQ